MLSPWNYTHAPGNNGVTLNQTRWNLCGYATTTGSPTANTIEAVPFACGGNLTISSLLVELVSGGSAGSARLGIYRNTSPSVLYPSTLVGQLEFSFLGADAGYTGGSLPSAVTLDDGLFWLAILPSVSKAMRTRLFQISGQNLPRMLLGYPSPFANTPPLRSITGAATYGPLPSTFPAGGTTANNSAAPFIFFR
jgi:hypothetical protein